MTGRRFAAVLGAGLAAAQVGHLVVFELRYGAAAAQLQSTGAHAYYPTVARTALGLAAALVLAGLFLVGAARVATGRRIQPGSAPSFWRLLSVLYTVQLACFAGQETLEALLGGGHAGSAPLLLLWGAAGQLPVAFAVTVALQWLLARLEPALEGLRPRPAPRMVAVALVCDTRPLAAQALRPVELLDDSYRRGPPSF